MGHLVLARDVAVRGERVRHARTAISGGAYPIFGNSRTKTTLSGVHFDGPLNSAMIFIALDSLDPGQWGKVDVAQTALHNPQWAPACLARLRPAPIARHPARSRFEAPRNAYLLHGILLMAIASGRLHRRPALR